MTTTAANIVSMIRKRISVLKRDQKIETDKTKLDDLSTRIDELLHLLYAINNPHEQIYTRFE
jgi:CII-binding regulator of phage lambda lysogenization HflD